MQTFSYMITEDSAVITIFFFLLFFLWIKTLNMRICLLLLLQIYCKTLFQFMFQLTKRSIVNCLWLQKSVSSISFAAAVVSLDTSIFFWLPETSAHFLLLFFIFASLCFKIIYSSSQTNSFIQCLLMFCF